MSTTEVSGSELMNRAVVVDADDVGKKRAAAVERVIARAVVKALAPNEEIMPRIIKREKATRRWDRVEEKGLIETSILKVSGMKFWNAQGRTRMLQ